MENTIKEYLDLIQKKQRILRRLRKAYFYFFKKAPASYYVAELELHVDNLLKEKNTDKKTVTAAKAVQSLLESLDQVNALIETKKVYPDAVLYLNKEK